MRYVLLDTNKLKITLHPDDLVELSLTYATMDYANPDTKHVLIKLLDQGKLETGFNPKRSKLYIEVYPTEDNGIVLYFTAVFPGQSNGLSTGRPPVPVIFSFDDVDILTDACTKVFAKYSHRIYKSSLFRINRQYRLVVYPLDYADRLSIYFISEYAQLMGEGEIYAAFVEEHGHLIIADKALDTIAQYFG